LKASAARADQLFEEKRIRDRDALMNAAIKDGKMAPARLAHWQAQYDADAEGITKIVNELPSVIPVTEIGHGGSGDEGTRTPQRTRRTSLPRPRRPASSKRRRPKPWRSQKQNECIRYYDEGTDITG